MGSLLKEYSPEEQVDPRTSGSGNEEASAEAACCETENGEREPQCSPNDEEEVKSEIEEGSNSENGSQVGQFKNVVAIVDPPRAGLHPTVRILLCNSTTYMVRSY